MNGAVLLTAERSAQAAIELQSTKIRFELPPETFTTRTKEICLTAKSSCATVIYYERQRRYG